MKKWVQSRTESAQTISRVESALGVNLNLGKSTQVECHEPEEGVIFNRILNMVFVLSRERIFPFLGSHESVSLLPSATVDEGAIRYLLNGADVMRPGIRSFDEWGAVDRLVAIKEEKKGRFISIGLSMVTSEEAGKMGKGSCFKNVHFVGDRFWQLYKQL